MSVDELDSSLKTCSLDDQDYKECETLPIEAENLSVSMRDLQCPFTWELYDVTNRDAFTSRIEDKIDEISEDEERGFPWHTFFLCLVLCHEYSRKRAISDAISKLNRLEDYMKMAKSLEFKALCGLRHVILSCKCFILFEKKQYADVKLLLSDVGQVKDMNNEDESFICGTRAAVCLEYGYDGDVQSVDYARRAILLDQKESQWFFLLGKALGRIRRIEGSLTLPTDEEINSLKKAIELSECVPYMIFLAIVYRETASKLRLLHKNDFWKISGEYDNMLGRSSVLYKDALILRPDCSHVIIRCAQGFMKFPPKYRDEELAKKCIEKALELAPNNAMAHHTAGDYYKQMKAEEKARFHFRRSGETGAYGGYMDLLKLNWEMLRNYDPVPDFETVLDKYKEGILQRKTCCLIGCYWYFCKEDFRTALTYWKKAVEGAPDAPFVTRHRFMLNPQMPPFDIRDIIVYEAQQLLENKSLPAEDRQEMLNLISKYSHSLPQTLPMSHQYKNGEQRFRKGIHHEASGNCIQRELKEEDPQYANQTSHISHQQINREQGFKEGRHQVASRNCIQRALREEYLQSKNQTSSTSHQQKSGEQGFRKRTKGRHCAASGNCIQRDLSEEHLKNQPHTSHQQNKREQGFKDRPKVRHHVASGNCIQRELKEECLQSKNQTSPTSHQQKNREQGFKEGRHRVASRNCIQRELSEEDQQSGGSGLIKKHSGKHLNRHEHRSTESES